MSGEINPRLTSEEIFSLIDKNKNGKIDQGDDLELANVFGMKEGSKKIDPRKVQDYDNKISVFSSYVKRDESLTVTGNYNETIVIHGKDDEAYILSLPKAQDAEFTSNKDGFNDVAKMELMKKGLKPDEIRAAGFNKINTKVENGKITLTLTSDDGYELTIANPQKNASISRDSEGRLVLDGVEGDLNITENENIQSREIILKNIYKESEFDKEDLECKLNITNHSNAPLTKTFPPDEKGHLSLDAAKALWEDRGFPESEALHGGFTQVSLTDTPGKQPHLHLESNIHGFTIDIDGIMASTDAENLTIDYNKSKHQLSIDKMQTPADIAITEDGSAEHNFKFSSVNQLHLENKTRKPVHITEAVMTDEKGKKYNDKSSFTYTTETNFDTFQREHTQRVTAQFSSSGVAASHRETRGCACSKHKWSANVSSIVGAFNFEIDFGKVVKTAAQVKLAPGSYIIQPSSKDYTKDEKVTQLRESNKKNIDHVTMRDYIITKYPKDSKTPDVSDKTKIGRSGRNWNGMKVEVDQSTRVTGDNNKTIVIYGDNNTAKIEAIGKGKMSPEAHRILSEEYHLNSKMIEKAGFTELDFVQDTNGNICELVLRNEDGTTLTLPSDEAFIFSESMKIEKDRDGIYHMAGFVGKIEGHGTKIQCTNVDLEVIEHDPENGYLVYQLSDHDNTTQDGTHIKYSTANGEQARVYRNKTKTNSQVKDNGSRDYDNVEITYPVPGYYNNRAQTTTPIRVT